MSPLIPQDKISIKGAESGKVVKVERGLLALVNRNMGYPAKCEFHLN